MGFYAEVSVRAHDLRATTVHGRPSSSPSKRRRQTEEILLVRSCISKNNRRNHQGGGVAVTHRHNAIIHHGRFSIRAKITLEALASNIRGTHEHDARDFECDITLDLCDVFGRL